MRSLAAGVADSELLSAAAALENWLNRAPQDAVTIQAVALGAAFNAHFRAGPDSAAALACIGIDADLRIESTDADRSAVRLLLHLLLAQAEFQRGRRFEGLDALDRAAALRRQSALPAALGAYSDAFASCLRGALCELGVEFDRAAMAYSTGMEKSDLLVGAEDSLAAAKEHLLDLTVPTWRNAKRAEAQSVAGLAEQHVLEIAALNALGSVRARWMSRARDDIGAVAVKAWKLLQRTGLPGAQRAGPLDASPLMLALPEEHARAFEAAAVAHSAGGRDADLWQVSLRAAWLAHGENRNTKVGAQWMTSVDRALPNVLDPLVRAFVSGRVLLVKPRDDGAQKRFLASLHEVAGLPAFEDVRVRAQFDEPISVLLEADFREIEHHPDAVVRARIAALLDALRGEKPSALALQAQGAASEGPLASPLCALDRLQRVACALQGRADTAAIVLHVEAGDYVFLCIGPGGLQISRGGSECSGACRALVEHLQNQMAAAEMTGARPGSAGVRAASLAAFRALPKAVRAHIASARTLLIVPDNRSARDAVPFELLHDGREFLGTKLVVARLSTLRALTRAVERLGRRAPVRHAFVAAASRVAGWKPLPSAEREARSVRSSLSKAGWDAPAISQEELTGDFFRKLFERASLLHVAAHGSVEAGDDGLEGPGEAIVLPGEARFTTDDLLRRRYPRVPLSYINCCSLGATRYLAGGISRGIAHTLVQSGAPAAIANLLPVDDVIASDIAAKFYALLARHPVGEALRRSRKTLALKGVNPILWGSTVLFGDPWTTLDPKAPRRPLSEELLKSYFSPRIDMRRRAVLRKRAARAAGEHEDDPRLRAASALLEWAGGIDDLATPQRREQWRDVIRLADEVDHLAASAGVRLAELRARSRELAPEEIMRLAEDVLPYLEELNATDDAAWGDLARMTREMRRKAAAQARDALDAGPLENRISHG